MHIRLVWYVFLLPPNSLGVNFEINYHLFCCRSFWLKVRFINFERTKLPEEILRHNLEEKRKYFSDICLEVEKSDAEVQVNFVDSSLSLSMSIYIDTYIHACMSFVGAIGSLFLIACHRLRVCTTKGFRIWLLLLTRYFFFLFYIK